jgi:hypothetical protein
MSIRCAASAMVPSLAGVLGRASSLRGGAGRVEQRGRAVGLSRCVQVSVGSGGEGECGRICGK